MTRKRKRIMRSFKLEEISAVDRPAQAGARMVLIKRDSTTPGVDEDLPEDYEIDQVPLDHRMESDMNANEGHLTKCLSAARRRREDLHKHDFGDLTNRDFDDALDALVEKYRQQGEGHNDCYMRLLAENSDAQALAVASTYATNRVAPAAR